MRHALLAIAAALLASTASAQTPPEVIEPYRAYRAALEAGDREAALEQAEAAYKAAAKLMPGDAQTAALAENLADILSGDTDRQIELYRVAYDTTPPDTGAERRVDIMSKLARSHMYRKMPIRKRDMRDAEKDVKALRELITATGLEGTTYDAEAQVIQGWLHNYFRRESKALDNLDAAIAIFEGPEHTMFSVLEYQAHLIRGEVLKNQDKPIEGAVALQKVMQNLEGELPADHPFIKRAFSSWLGARGEIQVKGLTDEALAGGVCKCWPYDEISENAPLPLKRVPPTPPRSADKSGYVDMKFDLDREGKPINIRAVSGTDRVFLNPSRRAVQSWIYEVLPSHTDEDLKGIATRLTYYIHSSNGRVLPMGDLKVWETQETDG